jgi:hypothetical protein
MRTSVSLKAFALWLVVLMLAIANGLFREAVLVPALGRFAGLVTSGILLSLLILLVALLAAPWYGRLQAGRYWLIGAMWLVLTLVFEFGMGRLVQHKPWHELLDAYTFSGGNVWPAVLLMVFVAPRLAAWARRCNSCRLRRRRARSGTAPVVATFGAGDAPVAHHCARFGGARRNTFLSGGNIPDSGGRRDPT